LGHEAPHLVARRRYRASYKGVIDLSSPRNESDKVSKINANATWWIGRIERRRRLLRRYVDVRVVPKYLHCMPTQPLIANALALFDDQGSGAPERGASGGSRS